MTDQELRRLFAGQTAEMNRRFAQMNQRFDELHRHFDVTAEELRRRDDLLAEGIVHLDQKIDRRFDALATEMRSGFEETHAFLKLSYRYKQ